MPGTAYTRRAALAAAGALVLGGCGLEGRRPAPVIVTGDRSYPDATLPGLLISAGDLAVLLADSVRTRVLDVRPIRDYRAGHIQGSRHVWWQDTMERNASSYGATLKPEDETGEQTRRLELIRLWGVEPANDIVVYGDHASIEAARVVWFLSFLGFDRVSMLDGGYAGWLGEGIDRIEVPDPIVGGAPSPIEPREGYYLLYEQVVNRLADGRTILLDIRTDAELRDTVGGTIRPGMVPGALSWPWSDLLDGSQALRPAAELRARADALGLRASQRVILLGRFATDCALSWLALQLIGLGDVPTYDGGWMEWSTLPGAAVTWL